LCPVVSSGSSTRISGRAIAGRRGDRSHCSLAEGEGQPHAAARQEAGVGTGLACREREGKGVGPMRMRVSRQAAHAAAVEETQKLSL